MIARWAAILAVASAAIAPATARQSPIASSASVDGQVTFEGAAGRPVRDAIVMIAGIDVGLVRATSTDDAGRFTFDGLPAGRFLLSAGKARYLPEMYGASRLGRPGIVVAIHAGETRRDLRLELTPGAIVSGRVTDDGGQPLPGVRVRVLGRRPVGTEISLTGDAGDPTVALTDDRGEYRVFDLSPGAYVVGAQPRGLTSGDARILTPEDLDAGQAPWTPPTAAGAAIGYAPVYFPGTPRAADASTVTLAAGEERTRVDLRMTLARFARIDGTIAGPGREPTQQQITLRPRGFEVSGSILFAQTTHAAADGRFAFTNVPPGDYTIAARALPTAQPAADTQPSAPPNPAWAMADVTVSGSDVEGLSLTWQPALTVSGRVQFEGSAQPPDDIRIRVGLRATPSSNVPNPPEQAVVDASGRFTLTGLLPGQYWLTAVVPANPVTQVPDWFAKWAVPDAADADRHDALDVPFDLEPGTHGELVLTLTTDAQQIDGTVRDAAGRAMADCPIVVFPVDRRLWFAQSRRIVVRRSNDAGEWLFGLASALPAGDYFVAAAPDLSTGEQFDPALLGDLLPAAQRVALGANASQTVALVVRPHR